jgi:hypothetical protein
MSADPVEQMVPGIRESIAGGETMCATFTIKGAPDRWVQYMDGCVNAAWPASGDPLRLVARLGGGVVKDHDAGVFITIRMETADVHVIARWIDAYFRQALAARSNYSVDCAVEKL